MSPLARRYFGCLVPLSLAAGGLVTCAMLAYASQVFLASVPIRDDSMDPTLERGQSVIVDNMNYWSSEPFRGEVAYVGSPDGRVIRRVIGRPGDTVAVRSGQAYLLIPDSPTPGAATELDEPYRHGEGSDFGPLTLGPGEYFVLADNRTANDSRAWGPLPRRLLFGSASFRREADGTFVADVGHHRYNALGPAR